MSKTYRQLYKQQQELQTGLASAWGYSVVAPVLDNKLKKQREATTPKLANITLRQFAKQLPKTDRIQQVQAEIKALHNQRKLMEENERAAQAAINGQTPLSTDNKIMVWVEEKIQEYNAIIEHRHLMKKPAERRVEEKEEVREEEGAGESVEDRIAQWVQKKFEEYVPKVEQQAVAKRVVESKKTERPTADELLRMIEEKRGRLVKADLNSQIGINREIAKLYRQFYEVGRQGGSADRRARSVIAEPPRSLHKQASDRMADELPYTTGYRLKSLKMMNNSASDSKFLEGDNRRKNSFLEGEVKSGIVVNKFKEAEYRKYYTTVRKESGREVRWEGGAARGKLMREVEEPYLDRGEMERYRVMEGKIRGNEQALELWKGKISEVNSNSRVLKKIQQTSRVKQLQERKEVEEMRLRQEELQSIIGKNLESIGMEETSTAQVFAKEFNDRIFRHEQEKEDILAQQLRKRNSKFNKLWGTKILVKYDPRKQAKQMLKGQGERKPNSGREGSELGRSKKKDGLKGVRQTGEGEEIEEMDNEHYERMCKNQKINLLLKRR